MSSKLKIIDVEKLQNEINKTVKSFKGIPGIYVSLNKTHSGVEKILKKRKIKTDKLFFIDCVSAENTKEEALHVSPSKLDVLREAIGDFIKEIPGKKFLIIDALSTLLIYNNENDVASFIKEVIRYSSNEEVEIIAISPKTKGEDLLNKIFNFFDEVERDDEEEVAVNERDEDLIY